MAMGGAQAMMPTGEAIGTSWNRVWSTVLGIVVINYAGEEERGARDRAVKLIDIIVTALMDGLFLA